MNWNDFKSCAGAANWKTQMQTQLAPEGWQLFSTGMVPGWQAMGAGAGSGSARQGFASGADAEWQDVAPGSGSDSA